mgnify:CR=1 FL=1
MLREKLPYKRRCITRKLRVNGNSVHFSVGLYPDGRPGELFIDMHKTGTAVRAWCESTAKLISLMLQYGVPLHELVDIMVGHCTEPFGAVPVTGHPMVTETSGVLDAIIRVLAQDFLADTGARESDWAKQLVAALSSTEDMQSFEIREAVEELGANEVLDSFLAKFVWEE